MRARQNRKRKMMWESGERIISSNFYNKFLFIVRLPNSPWGPLLTTESRIPHSCFSCGGKLCSSITDSGKGGLLCDKRIRKISVVSHDWNIFSLFLPSIALLLIKTTTTTNQPYKFVFGRHGIFLQPKPQF